MLPTLGPDGTVTYVQARYLDPPADRSKYDNPAGRLAPNPRLGWVDPARRHRTDAIVVCEGTMDALSAASHGFSSIAVLGATYVDDHCAGRIAETASGRRIVVAFDGDAAGRNAATILTASLRQRGFAVIELAVPDGCDLNSELASQPEWIHRQILSNPAKGPAPVHELARSVP